MLGKQHKPKLSHAHWDAGSLLCVSSLELTRLSPPTLHPQAFPHRLRFLLTFSSVNGHFNEYKLIPQMIDKLDSSHSFTDSFTKPLLRGAQASERPKKGVDHGSSPACKGNSVLWLLLTELQSTGLMRRKRKPPARGVSR